MAVQGYKNNGGVYANMDFPPYEHREYPKHVITGPYGKYEIVHNREEEIKLKGVLEQNEIVSSLEAPHDPEKDALIAKARFLGAPINRLWSNAKIQSVIAQAETAVDNLPPDEEVADDEPEETAPPTIDELDDLQQLVAKAKELGIKSARIAWGAERLKARIAQTE